MASLRGIGGRLEALILHLLWSLHHSHDLTTTGSLLHQPTVLHRFPVAMSLVHRLVVVAKHHISGDIHSNMSQLLVCPRSTSVNAEQLFSFSGGTIMKLRNQLSEKSAHSAVMVGQWASDPDLIAVDEFESQLVEGWTHKKKQRAPASPEAQGSSKGHLTLGKDLTLWVPKKGSLRWQYPAQPPRHDRQYALVAALLHAQHRAGELGLEAVGEGRYGCGCGREWGVRFLESESGAKNAHTLDWLNAKHRGCPT
ncbi:hypothetical protein B0H14DRAFT_2590951 [Mycena olivaceomarginata]|nr:hypothetical protein B0H14DRAFT_2590951 [Mycena olivaceomarginata]